MKYCWKCGAELRGTNPQFCSECGINLEDGKSKPTRTVGQTGNVNVTISNNFREAQRLYQINEYNFALSYIEDAISNEPNNTDYLNLKALIHEILRIDPSAPFVEQDKINIMRF